MNLHPATDGTALPTGIADALQALHAELHKVIGLGSSVYCIGQDLPTTPHGDDDFICPELVFPALAVGLLQHANRSLSIIEKLEYLLRDTEVPISAHGISLAEWLAQTFVTQEKFGQMLTPPVSKGVVNNWVYGRNGMPLDYVLQTYEITNHKVTPWDCLEMAKKATGSATEQQP